MQVRLINFFDVWGNAKDGYEVNNQCSEGEFELKDNATNRDVLQFLKEVGFFKKHVRMNMIRFCNEYMDVWMIEDRKGKPICSVEPIYN